MKHLSNELLTNCSHRVKLTPAWSWCWVKIQTQVENDWKTTMTPPQIISFRIFLKFCNEAFQIRTKGVAQFFFKTKPLKSSLTKNANSTKISFENARLPNSLTTCYPRIQTSQSQNSKILETFTLHNFTILNSSQKFQIFMRFGH